MKYKNLHLHSGSTWVGVKSKTRISTGFCIERLLGLCAIVNPWTVIVLNLQKVASVKGNWTIFYRNFLGLLQVFGPIPQPLCVFHSHKPGYFSHATSDFRFHLTVFVSQDSFGNLQSKLNQLSDLESQHIIMKLFCLFGKLLKPDQALCLTHTHTHTYIWACVNFN